MAAWVRWLLLMHLLVLSGAATTYVCTASSIDEPGRVTMLWATHKPNPSSFSSGRIVVVPPSGAAHSYTISGYCNIVPQVSPFTEATATVSEIAVAMKTYNDSARACANTMYTGRPIVGHVSNVTCYDTHPSHPDDADTDASWAYGYDEGALGHANTYCLAFNDSAPNTNRFYKRTKTWFYAVINSSSLGPHGHAKIHTDNMPSELESGGRAPCWMDKTSLVWDKGQDGPDFGYGKSAHMAVSSPRGGVSCAESVPSQLLQNVNTSFVSSCSGGFDGYICPVVCNHGYYPVTNLVCDNGTWNPAFKCALSTSTCSVPSASSLNAVHIANRISGVTGQGCGIFTMVNSSCSYYCNHSGVYTLWPGEIKCAENRTWVPGAGYTACQTHAPTSAPTTYAPTTKQPSTQNPFTRSPSSNGPTSLSPTTKGPQTTSPSTLEPTTLGPTTTAPVTRAPITPTPIPTASPTILSSENGSRGTNATDTSIYASVSTIGALCIGLAIWLACRGRGLQRPNDTSSDEQSYEAERGDEAKNSTSVPIEDLWGMRRPPTPRAASPQSPASVDWKSFPIGTVVA